MAWDGVDRRQYGRRREDRSVIETAQRMEQISIDMVRIAESLSAITAKLVQYEDERQTRLRRLGREGHA